MIFGGTLLFYWPITRGALATCPECVTIDRPDAGLATLIAAVRTVDLLARQHHSLSVHVQEKSEMKTSLVDMSDLEQT